MNLHIPRSVLALLSVVVLALVASACGDDDQAKTGGATKANSTDRAFVAGMVPHHQSAIDMAQVALERGQSPFVKTLAKNIAGSQQPQIDAMRKADDRLAGAGIKPAAPAGGHESGMEEDPATKLKSASPFDEAFIKEMLPHHKSALPMAQAELDKGGDAELKKIAQQIIDDQTPEIAAMEKNFGTAAADEEHGGGHSG
jgi:uncharacterized protein (DUF305 family)